MDTESMCYACEEPATSVEHVPPRCFFSGIHPIERRLIKVPSCEKHNLQKTGDDEFFRNLLSMHIDGNQEGKNLFKKKTHPSFQDSPTKLRSFLLSSELIRYGGFVNGKISVEITRVDSYFQLMAVGLYYNHFHEKFPTTFDIYPISFDDEIGEYADLRSVDYYLSKGLVKHGSYPDIFYYQEMNESEEFLGFRMVFYGGIVILAGVKGIANKR